MANATATESESQRAAKEEDKPPEDLTKRAEDRQGLSVDDWQISLAAALGAAIITIICVLADVSGATSVAIGLAVIATGLLVENLSKSEQARRDVEKLSLDIDKLFDDLAETSTERFNALSPLIDSTAAALQRYTLLTKTAEFQKPILELVDAAAEAARAGAHPTLRQTAVRKYQDFASEMSTLKKRELRVDASESSLLLEVMETTRAEVRGTSPKSIESDWWDGDDYDRYLAIQRQLIEFHDVKITRIFIAESVEAVYEKMKDEAAIKIRVFYIDQKRLKGTDRDLGARAMVIFGNLDSQVVHQTLKFNDHDLNVFSEWPEDLKRSDQDFKHLLSLARPFESLSPPAGGTAPAT